jgi:threonine/homoserine/homoserine lactone efflux protein
MGESLITISIVGFLAGFILSMPIAGPVSIYITSNALKGNRKYCNLVAVGASLADFIYVFIAVFCLTKLYSYYKPFIPYLLSGGAVFLFYIGYKIYKTKIDIEHLDNRKLRYEKIKNKEKGGFYTGLMLNLLNPALLLGWLASSFIVITFVSSLGFKTGGLDTMIEKNEKKFNNVKVEPIEKQQMDSYLRIKLHKEKKNDTQNPESNKYPKNFSLYISLC